MASPLISLVLLVCQYSAIALVGALNDEGFALLSFKQSMGSQTEGSLSNWNSSDVNPCSWQGVTCRNEKVISLSIPNGNLDGILPPAFWNLSALRHVNLKNNKLRGSLPVEVVSAGRLQSLVLTGNALSGPLPPEVGNLKNLQTLDLSQNSFNGSMPSSLVQCKKLKTLILAKNHFTGSIPFGLGTSLITLKKLNLSYNSLSGSIPSDIGNLSNLQAPLDLSHNFFNGQIPANLGSLPETVYVDLSYNNLSGPIPQKDTLVNLGPTAFIGNPLLCGIPLSVPCPPGSSDSNIQSSMDHTSHKSGHGCPTVMIVAITTTGICLIGLLFCYSQKKTSACKRDENAGGFRFEEKLKIRREMFCFAKKDIETLSENMDQCSFVPLDSQVDFDLEQLLKASAFLLGKSGTGIVYKVVLNNGPSVVVRRLGDGGGQRYKEFQAEVEAVGKIRHRNIVSLRAYCWSEDEKLLIYDYIPNEDLTAAIHGKAGILTFRPLSWSLRLRIMKGIAKGLAFLHECSPKRYVHGNLKPSNVLLGENMEPHIADFGVGRLANIAEESQSFQMEQMTSTPPQQCPSPYEFPAVSPYMNGRYYRAPETAKVTKPSQKWDVYSFGMILLEMISGKTPTFQIGPLDIDLVQWVQHSIEERKPLCHIMDPVLVHDWGKEDAIAAVLKIALTCTHKSPDRRPSMRSVSDSLEKLTS